MILPSTPKPCMVMSPPDRTWPNYVAGWLAGVTSKIHLSQAVEGPPACPHTSVRHGSAPVCLGRGCVHMCLCEVQSVCMSVYQGDPAPHGMGKEPSEECAHGLLETTPYQPTLFHANDVRYRSKGRTQVGRRETSPHPYLGWVVVKINMSLKVMHVARGEPGSLVPSVVVGPPN